MNETTHAPGEVRPPAIPFVDHPAVGTEGHAVASFGVSGEGFEIWGPLSGRVLYTRDRVSEIWHGNGIECATWEQKGPSVQDGLPTASLRR